MGGDNNDESINNVSVAKRLGLPVVTILALCAAGSGAGAEEQGLWQREKLTGDWGGARTALKNRGVEVGLTYIGETRRP